MVNPFSNLTDEKLMQLYQNDELDAFDVIYNRYKARIYHYVDKRTNSKGHNDDIVQNIFTKFHKSRKSYDSKFLLIKWIYTICRSELLDFYKKKRIPSIELKEGHLLSTDIKDSPQIDLDLENSLSMNEKKAITLRYYSDQDFKEISKALNTNEANTRKLVSRGIKKLKLKYKGGSDE